MSDFAINRRLMNGNDQAQRTTPTDSNIDSDHQARDNALNDQNDTPLFAMMTVEYTDDPTVRRLQEAFHTDAPQRPRGPFTLASSIARQMTDRDRQEFGLEPGTSQQESASNNNQFTSPEPNGFDLFDTSSIVPLDAVTDTPYPIHRSAPPNGTAALSSHPLGEASDTATMFNSTHPVNERSNSNQRSSYSLTDSRLRGEPVLDIGDLPDSHPNTASGNSNTADGIHASVDSETDCNNGNGRAQANPNAPMDDAFSVNVSDLRLGPASRATLAELALFSQYPEDGPNRAAPDEDTTASSSATPVRRPGLVIRHELANHSDGRAPARPNTPLQLQTTDSRPPFDLSSHHPGRRASNANLVHGSTPDNSTRDSTPRDDGRPTCLSDYLPEASPSAENREAWTGGLIAAPENAMENPRRPNYEWRYMNPTSEEATTFHNALNSDENGLCSESDTENFRSNTAFDTSAPTDHQDTAHLIAHGRIPNSDHPIATEERGRWTHAFAAAPVESNARPDVPSASPTQSDQQDRASSAVNNSNVNSRDRRAPRTRGSLRRSNTEEDESFWSEFDNLGNSRGSG